MAVLGIENIRADVENDKIALADAIVKALPLLREKHNDTIMSWLSSELQGYSNALNYYYKEDQFFPNYRVVTGSLRLMNKEGKLVNINHPLSDRTKYFISAPVSWMEESLTLPGEICFTEMTELSPDKQLGEVVVLAYTKKQLQAALDEIKKRLLTLLK